MLPSPQDVGTGAPQTGHIPERGAGSFHLDITPLTARRPSRVTGAALFQGPVFEPSGRPAPLQPDCGCIYGACPVTSINILIGVHLTMILCLLMQLGD